MLLLDLQIRNMSAGLGFLLEKSFFEIQKLNSSANVGKDISALFLLTLVDNFLPFTLHISFVGNSVLTGLINVVSCVFFCIGPIFVGRR